MRGSALGVDKSESAIRDMFAGVAPRYDLLNHLLSASLDRLWRRRAAAALDLQPGELAADLCAGTGDQALALARRGARVVATDFCVPMLALGERKYARSANGATPRPRGVAGDALRLPLVGGRFAAATVSFGLRNVTDLDAALAEMARLLEPGGRAAILEFAVPRNRALRWLYLFYFRRILPRIGSWISPRGSAYTYLPESVMEFPQRDDFVQRMRAAGFDDAGWRDLSAGVVCLYTGRRRE